MKSQAELWKMSHGKDCTKEARTTKRKLCDKHQRARGEFQGGGGAEWAKYPSLGGSSNPFSLEKSKEVLGIGPHTDDKGE